MFEHLVASTVETDRSWRSTGLSVASHAALLVVAVLVTRESVVATPAAPKVARVLPYIERTAAPRIATPARNEGAFAAPAAMPIAPVVVPVGLPPIELTGHDGPSLPLRPGLPDHDPFTPLGAPMYPVPRDAVHAQGEVDEPVHRLGGPTPVYPTALRAAGIEGVVQVRMVVDTVGRVEPGSIQMVHSTHVAFEGAALDALRAARFSPARVAGAAVRQLVQQSVRFSIEVEK